MSFPRQGTAEQLAEGESELVAAVDASRARLRSLEAQWEAARAPLDAQLGQQRAASRKMRDRADQQLLQIQKWRAEVKDLVAQTRLREQDQQRLLEEYEKAPKSVNRATFVRRITEIIKNIKKQEVEIVKIIADTREARGADESADVSADTSAHNACRSSLPFARTEALRPLHPTLWRSRHEKMACGLMTIERLCPSRVLPFLFLSCPRRSSARLTARRRCSRARLSSWMRWCFARRSATSRARRRAHTHRAEGTLPPQIYSAAAAATSTACI